MKAIKTTIVVSECVAPKSPVWDETCGGVSWGDFKWQIDNLSLAEG